MGLSTHVLDTMHGTPAAGMTVALYETHGEVATLLKRFTLNADGRNPDGPLFDNASMKACTYRWRSTSPATFAPAAWRCRSRHFWKWSTWTSASPTWTSTTTCRCCAVRGAIPPIAAHEPARGGDRRRLSVDPNHDA